MDYSNVHNILILGDSLSKGVVLNEPKRRYYFSESRYLSRIKELILPHVVDRSKFGATTRYGLAQLEKQLEIEKPDLVFIEYGSNDSDYEWPAVAKDPSGTHLPRLSPAEYEANLRTLIERSRQVGAIPVLTNLHPLIPERYFNWFTKGEADTKQATLRWLEDVRNIYWWQEMYSDIAQRTGRALDVPVIDMRGAFLAVPNYEDYICADGIHPNEEGHKIMYKAVMDRILKTNAALWLDQENRSTDATNG